jgi:hypothetical protein
LVAGACALEFFELHAAGGLTGQLRSVDGGLATGVSVQLMSIKEDGTPRYPIAEVQSDEDGHFRFTGVGQGSYYLGVNISEFRRDSPYLPAFYPSAPSHSYATVLTVPPGEVLDVGRFTLPKRLTDLDFLVRVSWPDGSPAEHAGVTLHGSDGDGKRRFQFHAGGTGSNGEVTVRGFSGLRQEVTASIVGAKYKGRRILVWQAPPVEVPEEESTVTLVLTGPPTTTTSAGSTR